ncbi:MAG: channel protein hemolysin family [Phycisphaerales bacterium]|nr:channel protein hemolysin family [Phycisphaerales bacterium]
MSDFRRWVKDPFPGLSHFFGALLAVVGLVVLLIVAAGRPWQVVSFSIYGTTMILLYLASGLAHSVYCSPRVEKWLDRFDYIGIYLLIAGTYTPICLITLRGPWGWSIFGVEWGLALIGIILVLAGLDYSKPLRTGIYVAMGWMALIAAIPTLHALPTNALLWLFAGGAAYSIGAIIFVTNRPHLWPGWFNAHDLWHCLVLTGSACHFILMLFFVA